jgi:hypothetical protein
MMNEEEFYPDRSCFSFRTNGHGEFLIVAHTLLVNLHNTCLISS